MGTKTKLGEIMEAWREEMGLTQREIGAFFTPPTRQATWSQIAHGRMLPSPEWLDQLEQLSGRSMSGFRAAPRVGKGKNETAPPPAPAPAAEPVSEPIGTGLRMWEWIARTTERFDEPEEVKQSASATALVWPTFQKSAKVRLVLGGGARVNSAVMEAHVQLVRNDKVAKTTKTATPAAAHQVMDLYFAEAPRAQPGLDLLLKGIIAICAYAQYLENKP